MKRFGTVLTFKSEVTKEEAARALRSIGFLLDTPKTVSKADAHVRAMLDAGQTVRYQPEEWSDQPFTHIELVRTFDDQDGGPVWYIP